MRGKDGFDLFAEVVAGLWLFQWAWPTATRKERACGWWFSTECPWPLYRKVEVVGRLLTVVGFIGLWLSRQIMQCLRMTERQWMETPTGSTVVWLLSGCFATGLLVLLPISPCLQKRTGVPLPGPRVPAWIAWPLIAVMILGFCLLLLLVLAAALQGLAPK